MIMVNSFAVELPVFLCTSIVHLMAVVYQALILNKLKNEYGIK
jgi:hypothetical protein